MPLRSHLKHEDSQGLIGISLSQSELSLAYILEKSKQPILHHVEQVDFAEDGLPKSLRDKVTELKLQGKETVILLPSTDYQIFLLEQPKVPDSEKSEAIKWLVAEYIDFSLEDAVVDYIELPQKLNNENAHLIYIIVARKSRIDELVNCVNASGLKIKAVDICQSALRQIALFLDDAEEGQALLHLDEDKSHLILFKEKTLYMMRELDLGLNEILSSHEPEKKENLQIYHDLSLEIQRSLDYCSSNLKNANITRLVLTPLSIKKPQLLTNLSNILGLPVRELTFSEFLENADKCPALHNNGITYAIGAALSRKS